MASDENETALSPFIQAAQYGNLELLKRFAAEFNSGETLAETFVRVKDSDHRTALHYAASGGQIHVCKYLIEELKIDVHIEERQGDTSLHVATICGQYSTAVYLLNVGANPNYANRTFSQTPLHHAAMRGRLEFMKLLIARGAEVDAKCLSGLGTPVSLESAKGNKDAILAALKFRANGKSPATLNCAVSTNPVTDLSVTPLVTAIMYHHIACIEALLQAGADPNFESHRATPLYIAVTRGKTEAVKLLLKYGANANGTYERGMTLLEMAAKDGLRKKCEILLPATDHIPYIFDWTVNGVLKFANSEEAKFRREFRKNENFAYFKSMAEASFRKKDYLDAVFGYSKALDEEPMNAAVLSNRSMCWARLKDGDQALVDAKACIAVKPDWPKAHYRAGVAYTLLKEYVKAADAFSDALKLDPNNKEIQVALREAVTGRFSSSINIGTNIN